MPGPRASASATARTSTRRSTPTRHLTSPTRPPSCGPGSRPMLDHLSYPAPERLCASGDLAERGQAVVFDVVAYLNRCVHVPSEMDWQPGEFLDSDREFIICSMHGATYEPATGRCAGGPCGRGRLSTLEVTERDGEVFWHPSRDIRPVGDER